jgi:hypothetical protein
MAWYPYTIVEDKVGHLSAKYNIPPEMIRGILGEFLESLNEACFKGSELDSLKGIFFSLGPEAAWHHWSIIYRCLQGSENELLSDSRSMWHETALRMDSRMSRFASILERWSEEKGHELEQQELEAREGTNG